MRRREVLAATAGIATPLLAGCGGDGGGDSGNGGTTTATTTVGVEDTVELRNNAFNPLTVKVGAGEAVRWINREDVEHTVTSAQFASNAESWEFDQTLSSSGDSVTHTFENEGIHEYYCTVHGEATMCGAVLVGAIFNTPGAYDAASTLPCAGTTTTQG